MKTKLSNLNYFIIFIGFKDFILSDFGKISQVKDKDKATDDKNDKKSNNTALIIIVAMSALAIVIIIAALIFYFSRRNYKKVPTTAIEDI